MEFYDYDYESICSQYFLGQILCSVHVMVSVVDSHFLL